MQRMTRRDYWLTFTTPAFLGGADQSAQWRAPPFKALLRQWWRMSVAKQFDYDHEKMRECEGKLFGNAWLDSGHLKSSVRVRLTPVAELRPLTTETWSKRVPSIKTGTDNRAINADVYLGYGPVQSRGKASTVEHGAIAPSKEARFCVMMPEGEAESVDAAIRLAALFGSVGSRSRNGWGSIDLAPMENTAPLPGLHNATNVPLRPLRDCLQLDWAHAIGLDDDGVPLVWQTEPFKEWEDVIGRLAELKFAMRRVAKAITSGGVGAIHFLGYPAGSTRNSPWKLDMEGEAKARQAAPLRFKVTKTVDGELRGVVYHAPCSLPADFLKRLRRRQDSSWLQDMDNQMQAWAAIHGVLRKDTGLTQIGAKV